MFSQMKGGIHGDEYQNMVEQMQLLELMFDSHQQQSLSRPPPVRTYSEPVMQVSTDFSTTNNTVLKSFPSCTQDASSEKDLITFEELSVSHGTRNKFVDDEIKPATYEGPTRTIRCLLPPKTDQAVLLHEVPRGISPLDSEESKKKQDDDQKAEVRKPVPAPRVKVPKELIWEAPKPAPRKRKDMLPHEPQDPFFSPEAPKEGIFSSNHSDMLGYEPIDQSCSSTTLSGEVAAKNSQCMSSSKRPIFNPEQATDVDRSSGNGGAPLQPMHAWMEQPNMQASTGEEDYSSSDGSSLLKRIKEHCLNLAPNEEIEPLVNSLLKKYSSINEKYSIIDVLDLLEENKNGGSQVHCLMFKAIKVLEKYATNLLKPESERPMSWRQIGFRNDTFQRKVGFMEGASKVFQLLGYKEEVKNIAGEVIGLRFPDSQQMPNKAMVENVATELCIAKFEVNLIVNENHPNQDLLVQTGQIPVEYQLLDDDDGEDDDNFEGSMSEDQYASGPLNGSMLLAVERPGNQAMSSVFSATHVNSTRLYNSMATVTQSQCGSPMSPRYPEDVRQGNWYVGDAMQQEGYPLHLTPESRVPHIYNEDRRTSTMSHTSSDYHRTYFGTGVVDSSNHTPIPSIYSEMSFKNPYLDDSSDSFPRTQPRREPERDFVANLETRFSTAQAMSGSNPRVTLESMGPAAGYFSPTVTSNTKYFSQPFQQHRVSDVDMQPALPQLYRQRLSDTYAPPQRPSSQRPRSTSLPGQYHSAYQPPGHSRNSSSSSNLEGLATPTNGDGVWSCKHCTFHNPISTKVCTMCFKTSWEDQRDNKHDLEIIQASYPVEQPPLPTVYVPPAQAPNYEREQLHVYYQDRQSNTMTNPLADKRHVCNQDTVPTFYEQQRHDMIFETPLQTDRFERDRNGASPMYSSGSYASHGSIPTRTMSVHERKKQLELAAKIKEERRNQEQLKSDAEALTNVLKAAETRGYNVDEVVLASIQCQSGTPGILDWLHRELPLLIEAVVVDCIEDVGKVSVEEAKQALIHANGDLKKASELCVTDRQYKMKELGEYFRENENIAPEDIKNAIETSQGNKSKATLELQIKVLEEFRERVFKEVDQAVWKNFSKKLMNKEIPVEQRTTIILAQFGMKSWGRAGTVVKLIDHFSESRGGQPHFIDDCIEAAIANEHIERAKRYMKHTCHICYGDFAKCNLFLNYFCGSSDCEVCDECMCIYIATNVQNIRKLVCPVCSKPERLDEDSSMRHFQNLSHQIECLVKKGCMQESLRQLFEEKLRDFSLREDPNFRWCAHCPEYGFLWEEPARNKMYCTKCKKYTCFSCKEKWEPQHEGISCEDFRAWRIANDPQNQAVGLNNHLAEHGITCPHCQASFELARGGCMHFTCSQCDFQFCEDCGGEFFAKQKCKEHPLQGIHCHHPRNCFYYLRDLDIRQLQVLLNSKEIKFDKSDPTDKAATCKMTIQKETKDEQERKSDEACGSKAEKGCAGFCIKHYKMSLAQLIKENDLDPIDIMSIDKLKVLMWRHSCAEPPKVENETSKAYMNKLRKIAKKKIPFKSIKKSGSLPQQQPQHLAQPPNHQVPGSHFVGPPPPPPP